MITGVNKSSATVGMADCSRATAENKYYSKADPSLEL